ncbi:MAG: tetratricopeptide repeat protein [Blastocatellia bacterium]|nr:tetratricopeptide repeat protein [Blastocatellia bacterium]
MTDLDRPDFIKPSSDKGSDTSSDKSSGKPSSFLKASSDKEVAELIGRVAEGEISLQEFFELSKEDIESIVVLTDALYEEDRLDDALVLLEGLIALDDKEAKYYNAAGAIFLRQEKYEEALVALNRAIELDPDNLDAYVNRGEVYLVNAHLEEAAADFEKAISMDPREENHSANRARQLVWGMYQLLQECERQGVLDPDFEFEPEQDNTAK